MAAGTDEKTRLAQAEIRERSGQENSRRDGVAVIVEKITCMVSRKSEERKYSAGPRKELSESSITLTTAWAFSFG